MVSNTISQLGGIVGGILKNVLLLVGLLVFSVGLFYLSRWIQNKSKRNKAFVLNSIIIDQVGEIDFDKLAIIKDPKEGIMEMHMKKRGGKKGYGDSLPILPKDCFVDGTCVLYNYAAGQYAPIHPTSWKYLFDADFLTNPKKLKLVDIGMKNYLFLKQRNIINRVEEKKEKFQIKMPWIAMVSVLALGLIAVGIAVFIGNNIYAHNLAARLVECKGALP